VLDSTEISKRVSAALSTNEKGYIERETQTPAALDIAELVFDSARPEVTQPPLFD